MTNDLCPTNCGLQTLATRPAEQSKVEPRRDVFQLLISSQRYALFPNSSPFSPPYGWEVGSREGLLFFNKWGVMTF